MFSPVTGGQSTITKRGSNANADSVVLLAGPMAYSPFIHASVYVGVIILTTIVLLAPAAAIGGPTPASDLTSVAETDIAYFIQVSDATLTLLPRLLHTLWHARNLYIIHFDKKIPSWQRDHAAISLLHTADHYRPNVVILPSETVTYRGISMVLNNLNAMQAAYDHEVAWTFFINVSGADYPLVSAQNQRRLLASQDFASRNRSFFTFSERAWWNRSKSFRYNRLFTDTSLAFNESDAQVIDSYASQPLAAIHEFTFVAAEAWMILHRSFVTYLLKHATARRMLLAFAYSLEPEEHFFPTTVYNEPSFNQTAVPHAMRHVVWTFRGKHSGQHPYYVDRLNKEDGTWPFRNSISTSGCFFTRKIRVPDSPLLDWIDTHVNGVDQDKAVKSDVNAFLERVTRLLSCVAELSSGDSVDLCLPDTDD